MAGAGEASIGCDMTEGVRTSLNDADAARPATVVAVLAELPEREPLAIEVELDGSLESLIVYRDGDHVRVWLNICPHAGRRLDWAPGKFLTTKDGQLVCAAHGATFELQRGECVAGPCRGDGLRQVEVEVVGGEARVRASGV
jgi:nitrite reductase/ring-hydroxylating ferredoxin subunit